MEWKEVKLGDLIEIYDSQRIPLSSTEREKRKGKYPYYGAQGIIDYIDSYIFDGEYILIAEDGNNVKTRQEDIAQIAKGKFWVNNHAHIVKSKINQELLCYIINNTDISGFVTGSAQPKLNQANLINIPVRIPNKEIQEKAASILSSLDSKIETNNKINAKLEEMAQALFKSWFVDFEPFKDKGMVESELGMIPEGWRVGKLEDIAIVTMGQSPSGKSYNEEGNGTVFYQGRTEFGFRFPSIRLYTTEPKRYAEPLSTLLSVRAPVGDINMATTKCCIGRGVASIMSKDECNSYIYYQLDALKPFFDMYNGEGTVFGSINKDSLNGMAIIIPPMQIMKAFEDKAKAIDDKMLSCFNENLRLSQLRDTLLPKLMSGEIEI